MIKVYEIVKDNTEMINVEYNEWEENNG